MGETNKRKLLLELSLPSEDCEKLYDLSAESGLTISKLLENFLEDLVGGSYSNGSDERMYAKQWFNRCWFARPKSKSFISYMLGNSIDIKHVFDLQETCEKNVISIKKYEEQLADSNYIDWENTYRGLDDLVRAYSNRGEWEIETREMIKDFQEDSEDRWGEIQDIWNDFLKFTNEEHGTLEEELDKLYSWWIEKNGWKEE